MQQPTVSVVIPCYRSAASIGSVVESTITELATSGHPYEIILVNDGSEDPTWDTIETLADRFDAVFGIDLMKNSGQFAALMCGLEAASGDIVITMDDDGQHDAADIPKLLDALAGRPDLDAVIGRFDIKAHGVIRRAGSRVMDWVFRASYGKPKDLRMSSFRALRRTAVDGMLSFSTARPVPGAMLLQTTSRVENVAVTHHERAHGRSGYGWGHLIGSVFDNVINASTAPLRVVAVSGAALAGLSAVLAVYYVLIAVMKGRPAPGFTTLALLIVFFGGATLLAIGVLGEYVARLVVEATDPPRYLVRADTRDLDSAVRLSGPEDPVT